VAAPLGALLAAGVLLFPLYRYELTPDSISYLSIAGEYLGGYWREAVNAYWGPLYSWCVAVPLALHMSGMLAARLASLGAGILTLFGLHRMALNFDMAERFRRAFLWIAAAMLLAFIMEANSPDLLFAALLSLYLAIIFNPVYPSSRYSGLLCGILGGLAYLAKAYGFFFFAAHFLVFSSIQWAAQKSAQRRRRIAVHFLAGLLVFCAISSAWIVVLHQKYGNWMLGTTGDFNFRLVGPKSAGYPHFLHLLPPPSPHAANSWQEPSPSWLPPWNVLSSRSNLKHQVKLIYLNAKYVFEFWTYTTPLFAAVLLAYVVLCLDSSGRRAEWIYPILTIALFSAGYLPITVQNRYFWLPDLLLLWTAFRTLDLLSKRCSLLPAARVLLVSVVVLSFLISPVLDLHAHLLRDRSLYRSSEDLKHSAAIRGRLASCADWEDSAYLAYILGVPYYGVPAPESEAGQVALELNPDYRPIPPSDADPKQVSQILSDARIDYFVVWPRCLPISLRTGEIVARAGEIQVVRLNHASSSLQ